MLTRILLLLGLLCVAVQPSLSHGQENQDETNPKIGLVLAGGGARGLAHIGVLRYLEEQQLRIDYIAGTSMGAIVGGLYAAGMSPDELEELVRDIDWENVFQDKASREYLNPRRKQEDALYAIDKLPGLKDGELKLPQGIIQGQRFYNIIKEQTRGVANIQDFDQLTPPFRAVSTDLETGEPHVHASGDLATAIRASMSVPAFFAPVKLDGRILVDGGLSRNLPVDVVQNMGADIIIAVDISTPLFTSEQMENALGVAGQLSNFLTRKNTELQIELLTERDILVVPNLEEFNSAEFSSGVDAIDLGYAAAVELSDRLASIPGIRSGHEKYAAKRIKRSKSVTMVSFIEIDTGGEVSEKLVRDRVVQPVGEPLDSELMKESLERINGISYFETVVYDIVERDGETGVKITATPKAWGPNYIQFGGRYYNDFSGNDGLTLRLGYLVAPRGADGSEWNTLLTLGEETSVLTEFFKPFSPASPWFYTAGLFAIQEQVNIFRDGDITSQTEIDSYGAQFRVGRFIGAASEVSLGYRAYNGKRNTSIGVGEPPDPNVEGGEIFLDFTHDTFDNISFPQSGHLLQAFALDSGDDWGSNAEFTQYGIDYGGAYDLGAFSLLGGLRANVTPSGIAPPERRFQVGGLFQLGGIAEEEVSANNLILLRAGVLYPWRQLLGSQAYLGGITSYITASPDYDDWDTGDGIFAGSLFLGLDTIIGAVYGGIGVNEGGGHSFHLLLGNPF